MRKMQTELDHANAIYDPARKQWVDRNDPDALIDLFERFDRYYRQASEIRRLAALALARLAKSEAKTCYVRGKALRAKITKPDPNWDQSLLLEAWNAYPQFRDAVLKIASIRVKKRELSKIERESGPPDFEQFKKMILAARKESRATPKVEIVAGSE